MNSVVQCLKRVDELKEGLKEFKPDASNIEPNTFMTAAARDLMKDLDGKGESFAPHNFVNTMR